MGAVMVGHVLGAERDHRIRPAAAEPRSGAHAHGVAHEGRAHRGAARARAARRSPSPTRTTRSSTPTSARRARPRRSTSRSTPEPARRVGVDRRRRLDLLRTTRTPARPIGAARRSLRGQQRGTSRCSPTSTPTATRCEHAAERDRPARVKAVQIQLIVKKTTASQLNATTLVNRVRLANLDYNAVAG